MAATARTYDGAASTFRDMSSSVIAQRDRRNSRTRSMLSGASTTRRGWGTGGAGSLAPSSVTEGHGLPGRRRGKGRPVPGVGGSVPPGVEYGGQRGAYKRKPLPPMYGPGMNYVPHAEVEDQVPHRKPVPLVAGSDTGQMLRTLKQGEVTRPPPRGVAGGGSRDTFATTSTSGLQSFPGPDAPGMNHLHPSSRLSTASAGDPGEPRPRSVASVSQRGASRASSRRGVTPGHKATGRRRKGVRRKGVPNDGLTRPSDAQLPDQRPRSYQTKVPVFTQHFRDEMERMQKLWMSVPKRQCVGPESGPWAIPSCADPHTLCTRFCRAGRLFVTWQVPEGPAIHCCEQQLHGKRRPRGRRQRHTGPHAAAAQLCTRRGEPRARLGRVRAVVQLDRWPWDGHCQAHRHCKCLLQC